MPKIPKITVLLPVYNGERYIAQAVDSVLNQTFADFEFLILNDGSTDGTAKILESYTDKRIRIIHLNNRSLTKNLNIGIEQAQGKYIARMDADDICHPERFEKQFAFMEENLKCAVVGCWYEFIDADNKAMFVYKVSEQESESLYKAGVLMHYMAHPAMMIRKSTLQKIGGYRHYFDLMCEDKDILYRLQNYGTLNNIQEPLLQYRSMAGGITSNKGKVYKVAYKHAVASILHSKNGKNNIDVTFENWNIINHIHAYASAFIFGSYRLYSMIVKGS